MGYIAENTGSEPDPRKGANRYEVRDGVLLRGTGSGLERTVGMPHGCHDELSRHPLQKSNKPKPCLEG